MLWVIALMVVSLNASAALDKVSLQLEWKYQFEHAGFIMAKELGFYERAGLDVELREYQVGDDPLNRVLSGESDFGIYNGNLALGAQGAIEPIIFLATYLQVSPLVVVTQPDIKNPAQLINKSIMGTPHELKYSSIALMLAHFGISNKNAQFINHTYHVDDFVSGNIDAMVVFRTNQLYELDRRSVEYNIIDPADYGFYMSAVNLFASKSSHENSPERVKRFVDASTAGWQYAMDHPEETIDVIYNRYSQLKSRDELRFEAAVMRDMMLLDLYPIGTTQPELTKRVFEQFVRLNLVSPDADVAGMVFEPPIVAPQASIGELLARTEYLALKKEITMCVDPEWMPFEAVVNGKHVGMVADIFAEYIQPQVSVPIRLVETLSWQQSLEYAKNRTCDILSFASPTLSRLEYLDFTKPYVVAPLVLVTNMHEPFLSDMSSVGNRPIAVVKGYAVVDFLRKEVPGINLIEIGSLSEGLEGVERGDFYGYVDNLTTVSYFIQKNFFGSLKVSGRLDTDVQLSIGVRNDAPILFEVLDEAVRSLDHQQLQSSYNNWVSVKEEVAFSAEVFLQITGIAFIILMIFLYYYIKLKKLNEANTLLASTDVLTGLNNRMNLDQVLRQQKENVNRYETDVSLIMIDIDLFKPINDRYGHLAGDEVLKAFALLLTTNVRSVDIVGRWGGEEFLIICPQTDVDSAAVLATKLTKIVEGYAFPAVGHVTISAGVSSIRADATIYINLSEVDEALYEAKANGRNQVVVAKKQEQPT